MHLQVSHGRKGSSTEFYEWRIKLPRVFVQRCGDRRWLLGITHTDSTLQVPLYLDTEADAKLQGRRLAQRYATAEHYTVEEDVRLAKAFAEEVMAARSGEGVTMVVDTTGRGDTYAPQGRG